MQDPEAKSVYETTHCSDCGEIAHRFCRDTPDPLVYGRNRPDHLILGYYCPGCHAAFLVSHIGNSPPLRSIYPLDQDWRVRFPPQLQQENSAYSPDRVGRQLLWAYPFLSTQRAKRSHLGRKVTRLDDARVSLQFMDTSTCGAEAFLGTLRDFVINSCGGSAVEHELTPKEVWVHADVPDRTRLLHQLARMERRFPIHAGYRVYYYNEGQRYEPQP